MRTIQSAQKLTPRKTTLVLFGSPQDPEVQERINKSYIRGQAVEVKPRPDFDTGLGQCGNHLCHCKGICSASFTQQP